MKIVVFFSGTGTNLKSILDHQNQFDYEVCACFTNNPDAKGLIFCKEYGINCKIINHKDFDDREEYDGVVNSFLENLNPDSQIETYKQETHSSHKWQCLSQMFPRL